jgi:hypothetical protein
LGDLIFDLRGYFEIIYGYSEFLIKDANIASLPLKSSEPMSEDLSTVRGYGLQIQHFIDEAMTKFSLIRKYIDERAKRNQSEQ